MAGTSTPGSRAAWKTHCAPPPVRSRIAATGSSTDASTGVRGAAAARQLQPPRVEIDRDDGVGARDAAQRGGELADHALAQDGDRLVDLQLGAADAEQRPRRRARRRWARSSLSSAASCSMGCKRRAQLGQPRLTGEPVAAVVAERQHAVVHAALIHPAAASQDGADQGVAQRPALAARREHGALLGAGAHLAPRDPDQYLTGARLRDLERLDLDVAGDGHQAASLHQPNSRLGRLQRTGPAASLPGSRRRAGTPRR